MHINCFKIHCKYDDIFDICRINNTIIIMKSTEVRESYTQISKWLFNTSKDKYNYDNPWLRNQQIGIV